MEGLLPFAAQNHLTTALLVLASITASFALTPLSIRLAEKLGIIDFPGRSDHTIHNKPTPRSGGIAILLSLPPSRFSFSPSASAGRSPPSCRP